ncbi:hypothetical protein [Prosthecobacter sp.]|uniref:hypothetical protein n=1 Tax=Prosthecobacter sp. TaxID=1965333 RepID=UPI002486EA1F|nr:hypothetical protein [Prosthecobacter sp.]MDI1313798.1 hypothetical protein [Prosthecobacter sp.]
MMHSLRFPSLALLGCLFLGACTLPGTFVSYAQHERKKQNEYQNATQDAELSDALAFNYANSVASIFQARATGGRYTRETSDTALAGLAAFTAASQTWTISKHSLGVMGLTGLGILELRKIFDSKARAMAYLEASHRIRLSMKDFRAYNLNATNSDRLSPNGWTLANVTMANIQIVEMLLSGRLPSPSDLEQASEPITPEGAFVHKDADRVDQAVNNIPAPSLTNAEPGRTGAEARLMAAQLKFIKSETMTAEQMTNLKKQLEESNSRLLSSREFTTTIANVDDLLEKEIEGLSDADKLKKTNERWNAVVKSAGLTGKIRAAGDPLAGKPTMRGEDIQEFYEKEAKPTEQRALVDSVKMYAPPPVKTPGALPAAPPATPAATTTIPGM